MLENLKGKYCIFRGDRSGVFAGNLAEYSNDGKTIKIENCRRLWYWEGACSISEIALNGVVKPDECKFTVTIDELIITDCIEIIKTTEQAEECIKGVKEWRKS